MTVRELIARLQEHDLDTPVCVGNEDVYFVETYPAYYDGALQQLVHDESKRPYWTIVGAKVITSGFKVKIHTLGIDSVMVDMPDLPVECPENRRAQVEQWRREAREIIERANRP